MFRNYNKTDVLMIILRENFVKYVQVMFSVH